MKNPSYNVFIDSDAARGVVEFGAICRGQDMLGAMEALFSLPGWRRDFDSVWDFSSVVSLDFHLVQVEAMMAQSRELTAMGQRGRLAAVVVLDDHMVVAKLLAARLEKSGREGAIFATRGEAEEWLGQKRQTA